MARLIATCVLMGLTVPPAYAEETVLLACGFANGKSLSLTAHPEGVTYRFGRPGLVPELELNRPYAEVDVTPWSGVGGSIWEELSLTNGDVSYLLWGDFDRMTDDHDMSGGIIVLRGEEDVAHFDCLPETVSYTVFGFADAYEAAGYCWDSYAMIWKEDCE
jgi:hypothetical protein